MLDLAGSASFVARVAKAMPPLVDDPVDLNHMEQARNLLSDALKGVPQGILFLDLDLRVIQIDANGAVLLNIDVTEALGKSVLELFPLAQEQVIESMLAQPGTVFEHVSEANRRKTVALETGDGIWVGILDQATSPHATVEIPATQRITNPPVDSVDITPLLQELAESRNLTELTHALVAWMNQTAPQWSGILSVPSGNSLIHIAQWPTGSAWIAPVALDEIQAVRQGRTTVTDQTPLLPTSGEKTVVPVYRDTRLICVIAGNTPTALLEQIGYACGLQIHRF